MTTSIHYLLRTHGLETVRTLVTASRMILIYLQTQALRSGPREVELGRSLKSWMKAMGVPTIGGATYKIVSEQARRISACRLTFFSDNGQTRQRDNGSFADGAGCLSRRSGAGGIYQQASPFIPLGRPSPKIKERLGVL